MSNDHEISWAGQPGRVDLDAPGEAAQLSRRHVLRGAAAVVAGGAVALTAGTSASAQGAPAARGQGTAQPVAGRKFKAFIRYGTGAGVQELTLRPLMPRRVLIRTETSQCCYTVTAQALGTSNFAAPMILGHGGIGVVEAVAPDVTRVQVGDRVMVVATPQCGQCHSCLNGRADHCLRVTGRGEPNPPIADMADGTPVVPFNHKGGISEYMMPPEDFCVPLFTNAPSLDLAMLHCVGLCGLGATMTMAPIEAGSDVVVFGAGPVGLSAIQGARIKGATRIIAIDPVRARREAALKLGATLALDPNAEGDRLVAKIQDICKGRTPRTLAGGGNTGPDFVIEAVGGDAFPPKAEVGPDPTGVLPLQQAWDLCSATGHLVTTSVGHPPGARVSFPASGWANGAKNHHPGNLAGANPQRDIPKFVTLLESGAFNAKAMATATFPLDRAREAFQAVSDRTTIAAVIVI